MRFSERTAWQRRPNRLSEAVRRRREAGGEILDLTLSNPTRCGLDLGGERVLRELRREEALVYEPDPRGSEQARRAVAEIYRSRRAGIGPDQILLSASTSEAYTWLFRLLCDPGDAVLAPAPSYPLFDFLSRVADVSLAHYPLREEEGFRIDLSALEETITPRTRALLVVSPGNPTGIYLADDERERLVEICLQHGLALVADEVFAEFGLGGGPAGRTLAGEGRVPTFVLDGISKMLALPQLKLGWIVASGPPDRVEEALARLEVIADTFLSVGTPVQAALPGLLSMRASISATLLGRLRRNLASLRGRLAPPSPAHVLPVEGGWSAILRVPATRSDEEWALGLLEEDGILLHPGYFFDFPAEGRLVVSLLPEERIFDAAIERVAWRLCKV